MVRLLVRALLAELSLELLGTRPQAHFPFCKSQGLTQSGDLFFKHTRSYPPAACRFILAADADLPFLWFIFSSPIQSQAETSPFSCRKHFANLLTRCFHWLTTHSVSCWAGVFLSQEAEHTGIQPRFLSIQKATC